MDQLGAYTNLEEVGEGGWGITYRAWDPSLSRHVAIKKLKEDADQTSVGRFRGEGKAIAAMEKQDNIVQVYGAHLDEPPYYLVLEYLQGRSLASLIADKGGRLTQRDAVALIVQVLRGLEHAHMHGVIHRDIKPDNIIVNDAGKATITDFGIARISGQTRATAEGMSIGTVEYMSPEQAKGPPVEVDRRTDIYSAGVVLYEMLTGRTPFAGGSTWTVMSRIVNDAPAPPGGFYREIPPALEMVVLKALAKDPRDRFQSATDMAQALEAALREPERIAGRESVEPHPPPPPPRRPVPPLAVALVVVLLLIGGLLYAIVGKRPGAPTTPLPESVSLSVCSRSGLLPGPYCSSRVVKTFTRGGEPRSHCSTCPPPESVSLSVCSRSGLLPGPYCSSRVVKTFTHGREPRSRCTTCRPVEYATVRVCSRSGLLPGPNCSRLEDRQFRRGGEPRSQCTICKPPTPEPKKYKCPLCNEEFDSETERNIHAAGHLLKLRK